MFLGAVIVLIMLLVWFFWPWLASILARYLPETKELGTFGDVFGGLNTLFTGAALLAIAFAAYLQNSDLRDAREQHEDTQRIMKRQKFETTFFNIVDRLPQLQKTAVINKLRGEDVIHRWTAEISPMFIKPTTDRTSADTLGYLRQLKMHMEPRRDQTALWADYNRFMTTFCAFLSALIKLINTELIDKNGKPDADRPLFDQFSLLAIDDKLAVLIMLYVSVELESVDQGNYHLLKGFIVRTRLYDTVQDPASSVFRNVFEPNPLPENASPAKLA